MNRIYIVMGLVLALVLTKVFADGQNCSTYCNTIGGMTYCNTVCY